MFNFKTWECSQNEQIYRGREN